MDEHYDVQEAIKAHERLCRVVGYPQFAPYDGVCYRCHQNIYEKHDAVDTETLKHGRPYTGISVEEAGSKLITGCPHCNRSFCD